MKKSLLSLFVLVLFARLVPAQIINGQDTLYGNEWIRFDQSYFKIPVATDGMYRLTTQTLSDAGVPLPQFTGAQLQIFHNGEEIPLFVSTDGALTDSDFIEFYGQKNTSELDRHLFQNPDEEMMNPRYSLITDTAAYFLTWSTDAAPLRFETVGNDLSNLPQKEEFYQHELLLNYTNYFFKKQDSHGISSSDFGPTEGFAGTYANVQAFNLNPSDWAATGGNAQLSIRYAGNLDGHQQLITLSGQPLATDEFYGYVVRQLEFDIPNSSLSNSMELKFQGLASATDKQRISNIVLRYPRLFNFDNQTSFAFKISASPTKKYIEVANFNAGGAAPILYDLTNARRMETTLENGVVKFALPPSAQERSLVLVNESAGVTASQSATAVAFTDYGALDANYIILSNPRLYDDGNGNNWVQEYAGYRSSLAGGSFSTVVVDVQQLYDQFGWGLNRHPLAIRNFGHFVKKEWASPQYFFIIGKGREYNGVRTAGQLGSAANESYFVPTFGYPGSDNLLLAGSDGFTPVIPVGRIAASKTGDIKVYLDKVKEFEANRDLPQTIADRGWMKHILHLGGGNGAVLSEQLLIRSYLENMAEILKDSRMGTSSKSYYKTSTDPIQQPQTEDIFNYINSGVSLITFFGHSSVGVFDFSIDFPDNYKNKGKYPWMISLGCYAGNIHTSSVGIGERFIFLKDAGSIAFTATAGQGYISSLNSFTTKIYEELGGASYGQSIGSILQKTIDFFPGGNYGVDLIRQQFNLLGDPSLKLNPSPGPDFVVDAASVKFSPEQVNANQQKFSISLDVVNIGENVGDSVQVKVTQQLPDASQKTSIDTLLAAPGNRNHLVFDIPVSGKNTVGQNRFFIKVDATGRVAELPLPAAEMNNELVMANGELGATLFIRDNSAVPIFPPEFGMTGPDVTLKACTTDPLALSRKYLLQIDTTELFNSGLFQHTEIIQKGGVIRWQPPIAWQDETVYYWRISPDSLSAKEGYNWNGSSFLFKSDGSQGWNQSHYYQFLKDELVNMELAGHSQFQFLQTYKDYWVRDAASTIALPDTRINSAGGGFYWGAPDAGVYVLWIDSIFKEPIKNYPPGQGPVSYGLPHPWGSVSNTFIFNTTTPSGREALIEFLDQVVSPGEYVIFFTIQRNLTSDYKPQDWATDSIAFGKNIFQILEQQGGALHSRQLESTGSVPYIVAYKKGGELLDEVIATGPSDIVELSFNLQGNWDRGYVRTDYIGPANKWDKLAWHYSAKDDPLPDTVGIKVFGSKGKGSADTLLYELSTASDFSLEGVDAKQYPFLALQFDSKDSMKLTSANLDYWRVIYEGVPEFTFNPDGAFGIKKDTVQAGEPLILVYAVENLSSSDGDSLLVKYAVADVANHQILVQKKLPGVMANDTILAHLSFDTRSSTGRQNLLIELNPANDQPELTHANNFLQTDFFVEGDIRNPLLDVTFDGVQILDGEIVSPTPHIQIALKDENPFLLLDDTSRFKLFILYPDSVQPTPIALSSPGIQFTPATSGNKNSASITFEPQFTNDGEYALIVQARDVSGNTSGLFDFKRKFKVITSSGISNVVNYPNPFSTATRFLYTLTGSKPPAKYRMQIMTVSGRIVREVSQQELGELRPGTHLTDFVWDGRDGFGDQLANGVYLYRLVVEDEKGGEWEKFETGVDRFFTEGFGKMVLIR
ncbi:MAG: hypothetical protein EPO28_17125 [Saprospiraceae bacterium]|nr:MAG: hypothetical protein EPO28_17125 [Saprospiraceae bacterium]